jgi:hypothetical protein
MTAAAPKLSEVLNDAVRARIAPKIAVLDTPNDVPSSNAFYKVMFDPNLDPDAKKAAVIKLLVFPGSKEESRAAIKEYNAFESYMQSVREKMATRIIELQDTDTFSILQDVINNLNNQLLDFEKPISPTPFTRCGRMIKRSMSIGRFRTTRIARKRKRRSRPSKRRSWRKPPIRSGL